MHHPTTGEPNPTSGNSLDPCKKRKKKKSKSKEIIYPAPPLHILVSEIGNLLSAPIVDAPSSTSSSVDPPIVKQ